MGTEKRLIDANALHQRIKERLKNDLIIRWLCDIVNDAPTVDAVEVVRCKNCKHFWESFSGTHSCKLHKGLVGTKYDAFCSYGERKDND